MRATTYLSLTNPSVESKNSRRGVSDGAPPLHQETAALRFIDTYLQHFIADEFQREVLVNRILSDVLGQLSPHDSMNKDTVQRTLASKCVEEVANIEGTMAKAVVPTPMQARMNVTPCPSVWNPFRTNCDRPLAS